MTTSDQHCHPARGRAIGVVRATCLAALFACAAGCESPLGPPARLGSARQASYELRETVTAAIDRELREQPPEDERITTVQPPSPVEEALAERRDELDGIAPALPFTAGSVNLGRDLLGQPQHEVAMSLRDAIMTSVQNNLAVQRVRLQPGIAWEQVLAAEYVFDAVLFANVQYQSTEEPMPVRVVVPPPPADPVLLGTGVNVFDAWRFETGVRQPLWWGGEAFVSTELSRTRDRTPGIDLFPDPAYAAAVRLGIVQPLLRGFGADANLATIRLSRNLYRRAIYELQSELLDLVAQTEAAYWDLYFAWANLEIQQWLVEEGIQVRDVLERRRDFDVRLAEYADAVATVEQRLADVIRARREVRAASDRLKGLMNDPELSVAMEEVIVPVDPASESPITFSLRDAVMTAVANRPEIEQAVSFIDDAEVRRALAKTEILPQLNLLAEIAFSGLDESFGRAYREAGRGDFVGYILGAAFEWPIGSRVADADWRRARLERSAAVYGYRETVQNVILDVKGALRDVVANYELIGATRSFRVAQAENLRALRVREELVGLTPEFLNLVLTRQATLATARQQEILAIVNFDQAVARLYRALGTGLMMHGIDVEVIEEPEF